ncbi:MAG: hypothetical protein JWM53_6003 [bacterium]|nr:hypothetical protein [bacterium]
MTAPKRMKHGTDASAFHAAVKRDAALWDRLTISIGTMPNGEGGVLALANCRVCLSTLAKQIEIDD